MSQLKLRLILHIIGCASLYTMREVIITLKPGRIARPSLSQPRLAARDSRGMVAESIRVILVSDAETTLIVELIVCQVGLVVEAVHDLTLHRLVHVL